MNRGAIQAIFRLNRMKLRGLGQVSAPAILTDLQNELQRSIVTPAERTAQYSLLGATAAAAVAAIVALSMRRRPTRSAVSLFALLAVPVAGAGAGIYLATREAQA